MLQPQVQIKEQTKKDYNRYPSIKPIISKILKIQNLKQTDELHFEIKFAKLKSNISQDYKKYLQQSKQQIVLLSSKANFKDFVYKAEASQQQYQIILKNLIQLTPPQQQSKTKALQIVVSPHERLIRQYKNQNQKIKWSYQNKQQQFARQFNVIEGQKQFRVNLSLLKQSYQLQERINKLTEEELSQLIKCVRIMQNQFYEISNIYYVVLTKVYNPKLTELFKRQISNVYKQYNSQKLDEYILSNVPSINKQPYQIEIQLRLNASGAKLMYQLKNRPVKLNHFIGDKIRVLRNLANLNYKQIQQADFTRQEFRTGLFEDMQIDIQF